MSELMISPVAGSYVVVVRAIVGDFLPALRSSSVVYGQASSRKTMTF
jgi:hypothetical protein